ncbi:MAG: hypothetical protein K2G83_04040 [Ruminococcus sp.]|nr:hypothetical protein [Ruminococcus sp.]
MKINISEQENFDVARIMMLTADQKNLNPYIAELLRRGASLLRKTTCLCTVGMKHIQHQHRESL